MDGTVAASVIVVNLYAQDLGATPFLLGLLGTTWGLSYGLMAAAAGRLADCWPRRGLLLAGIGLFALSTWAYQWCTLPLQLVAIATLAGGGTALFWPTFETLLYGEAGAESTRQRMGWFNLGWTLGYSSGWAVSGFLKEWGTAYALNTLAVVAGLNFLYVAGRTRGGLPPARSEVGPLPQEAMKVPPQVRRAFLYAAWAANFTLWFSGGAVGQLFPKLGRARLFPDRTIGLLLSLVLLSQAGTFLLLARSSWWQYRWAPLLGLQGVSGLGLLGLVFSGTGTGLGLSLLLLGLGRGMSYSASLYYGLAAPEARGANSGVHETMVGLAYTTGPFLGGLAAQHFSLRAPFALSAAVVGMGMAVEGFILLTSRRAIYRR